MEAFLRQLLRLQELSLELSGLDARISQVPITIKAIDEEETAAGKGVQDAKDRLAASQKGRKGLEEDLQDLEQKVSKYNDQSREVKTNDQYRAIMHEIDGVKTLIGDAEEKILLAMEEADALAAKIKESERVYGERKKDFAERRGILEAERRKLEADRGRVEAELRALGDEIPEHAMKAFTQTAQSRGEVVMAEAVNERCTVCGVRLRPAVFHDVRKNDSIIYCESCRRILYYVAPPAEGAESTETANPEPA